MEFAALNRRCRASKADSGRERRTNIDLFKFMSKIRNQFKINLAFDGKRQIQVDSLLICHLFIGLVI